MKLKEILLILCSLFTLVSFAEDRDSLFSAWKASYMHDNLQFQTNLLILISAANMYAVNSSNSKTHIIKDKGEMKMWFVQFTFKA